MKCLNVLWFILLVINVNAQVTIEGILKNKATNEPIPFAVIYVVNSEKATTSDDNGFYQLENLPYGKLELIVKVIGYKDILKEVAITDKQSKMTLDFELEAKSYDLSTVEISAKKTNKQKKYLKRFTKAFLGYTTNASKCTILNPDDIIFKEEDGKLIATADQLIQIENQATGYQVLFLLEKFELKGNQVIYAGKPVFKPLKAVDEKTTKQWTKQREKTYNGSMRHFFTALLNDDLLEEGFELQSGVLGNDNVFRSSGVTRIKDIVKDGNYDFEKNVKTNNFLKIIYNKEKGLSTQQTFEANNENNSFGTSTTKKGQTSYLYFRKSSVAVNQNGLANRPELVLEYGYWANERVADLLPIEYQPNFNTKKIDETVEKLNGFKLSKLEIPKEEIQVGTKEVDAIPAISAPKFLKASQVDFLKDDDFVFGISYNGVTRAYPIRILNWHEIVNDNIGSEAVEITYCPLCRSGMAFLATIQGQNLSFGVSGLLYNSDVLLYDKATQSLWSQILGKAIAGELSGEKLTTLPLAQTTWVNWKSQYPETWVLSTETGYLRDYSKTPYQEYTKSDKLMFPVENTNNKYSNKELILGITINGKHKAYPFSELAKTNGFIKDTFENTSIEIKYDKASNSAKVIQSDIENTTMYWFAWYAFYSDTAIFKAKRK